jgi:hypothetical protein
LTERERERLRLLIELGSKLGYEHIEELQDLAARLLQQDADKSLRLARLSTQMDEEIIEVRRLLAKAEGDIKSIPLYFRCVRCGEMPSLDGTWRYLGPVPYEHKCPDADPQCGYFPVRLIQHGEDGAGEPKTKREPDPIFKAIVTGLAAGFGAVAAQSLPKVMNERWVTPAPSDGALYPRCKCSCGAEWIPRNAASTCSSLTGTHVRVGECDPLTGPGGVRVP